jgi:hypothetical protein
MFVLSEKVGKIGFMAHFWAKMLLLIGSALKEIGLAYIEKIDLGMKSIVRGTFTQGLSSLKRRTSMVLRSIFGQKCYY